MFHLEVLLSQTYTDTEKNYYKKDYFPPLESQEKLPCNLKNIIGTYDMITKIQAHGQQFLKTFVLLIENGHGNCYAMVFR